MQREISFEWSPQLVGRATRRFILRHTRRSLIVIGVLIVLSILALRDGRAEALSVIIIILSAFYGLSWYRYYRRALKVSEDMPDRKVTVKIEPESITFQTSEQSTTMKWSRVKTLWRYPDVLFLFTYSEQTFSMLPVAPLGEDAKLFIEEKVRAHGGQVA